MKKNIILLNIGVVALFIIFWACAPGLKPVTQADVDRLNLPGFDLIALENARVEYALNCGKCHSLYQPESRTYASWDRIMPKMAKEAKIDHSKETQILLYLKATAKADEVK